jgi:Fe-S-cluster containining protein
MILETCDGCGSCCRRTPIPPFEPGEEAALGVPESLLEPVRARIAAEQHFDFIPCVWFDESTQKCLHYELRPAACRNFAIGGDLCRLSRWDDGLDA